MPRANHKEGCQCVVCKRMAAIAPAGITLGSINVGAKFKMPDGIAYIKYGTADGIVAAERVGTDGDIIRLPEDTIVEVV